MRFLHIIDDEDYKTKVNDRKVAIHTFGLLRGSHLSLFHHVLVTI